MAFRAGDGFDHYNGAADIGARQGFLQWNTYSQFNVGTGILGVGKSVSFTGAVACTFANTLTTFYTGIRMVPANNTNSSVSIYIMDQLTSTQQYAVTLNNVNGQVTVVRGTTTLGQSNLNAFQPTSAGYWEVGGVISATVGTITVKFNGVAIITLTGVNNISSSNASMSGIEFSTNYNGNGTVLDDFYICDGTAGPGTFPCNTFLGDTRIDTIFPTSNNVVSWTPLTGTNWSEINEVAFDGDASFNSTSTVNNQDTVNFGALTGTINAIYAVIVTGAYRKDDAGTHTLAQQIISSGTQQAGGTNSIGSTYTYISDVFVEDPSTSASWTTSAVNALKAGYKLLS